MKKTYGMKRESKLNKIAYSNVDTDSSLDKSKTFDPRDTRRSSYSTLNNFEEHLKSNKPFAFGCSKEFVVYNESQNTSVSSYQARMHQVFVYKYPPTPKNSSYVSILNQSKHTTDESSVSDRYPKIDRFQQDFLKSNSVIINGDKHESKIIKLYRNSIINEIYRLMISIGMVEAKAILLFGLKKTLIFFDSLDEIFFNFESPGIFGDFVPNMAQYAVRQHVISFFKHAGDSVEILTQLLLCCPNSESLQKMTEEDFISLMQRVIDSFSLKTKSNKGAKPSLKGIKWIMVDSEEFVRAVGGEILEDIIYRRHHGDEMIVDSFIDTKRQPSNRKENRPILPIYFPSDCRLFIYIPTENGSYWHQSDMQRASRINQQKKNSSNLSNSCNPHGHQVR